MTRGAARQAPEACRAVLLTPAGRGAIATVAVYGPQATGIVSHLFQPAAGRPLAELALGRIVFGRWSDGAGAGEELVVCRHDPQHVEVHCHGGPVAAENLLRSLAAAGCARVDWQTWAAEQEPDRIAAEARLALASARTQRAAAVLLDQYQGALRAVCLRILGDLESGRRAEPARQLEQLDQYAGLGLHLAEPWRVVLAGPANVGKSSLINASLGYCRSIVFDQPGTTRDVVTTATALDGWPVELSDTAGLRSGGDAVEMAGVLLARDQIADADLVVLVFDASQPWSPQDQRLLETVPRALVVHNKCDRLATAGPARPSGWSTSAVTGAGMDSLLAEVMARLVPQAPGPGTAVPFTLRQVAAVRQARRAVLRDDLPAAAAEMARLLAPATIAVASLPSCPG